MLRNINGLIGQAIQATDGELGKVDEFYFDDRTWRIRYLVVETGTWLAGRKVLISPTACKRTGAGPEPFAVALTKEQVRNSPDTDTKKTVSRQHEVELHEHYAWPLYWGGGFYAGGITLGVPPPAAFDKPAEEAAGQDKEDPHLRGTRAVTGYGLHAADGPIGQVEDYIADLGGWIIRYLVVDVGLWLPGKKVLISPHWIKSVAWETSEIFVDLSREAVRKSPEFDPSQPVSEDYESVLFDHYGRPKLESKDKP